jgi:esterase/lipase superfamily enzyme
MGSEEMRRRSEYDARELAIEIVSRFSPRNLLQEQPFKGIMHEVAYGCRSKTYAQKSATGGEDRMATLSKLAHWEVTRRMLLTGTAGAALSGGVAVAEELPATAESTTVGRASFPVRQVDETIFFVTNRPATGDTDMSNQFGVGHADVSTGCLKVAVTEDRQWRSSRPSRVRSLRRMSFKEMTAVANRKLPRRGAILFAPGYNNSFNEMAITAATLKRDIQTASSIFTVAWNSQGSLLGYSRDTNETWFTEQMIRNLLVELFHSAEFTTVQIIGHSLGARAVVGAINNISKSPNAKFLHKLSRIVLAAPDVDVAVMNADFIPVAERYGFNTALYVSNKDFMMRISEFWNGQPRVGGAWGPIYINPRVDTIDISEVDSNFPGHSTMFESSRVANDIYYFLEKGHRPRSRFELHPLSTQSGTYWRMRP